MVGDLEHVPDELLQFGSGPWSVSAQGLEHFELLGHEAGGPAGGAPRLQGFMVDDCLRPSGSGRTADMVASGDGNLPVSVAEILGRMEASGFHFRAGEIWFHGAIASTWLSEWQELTP